MKDKMMLQNKKNYEKKSKTYSYQVNQRNETKQNERPILHFQHLLSLTYNFEIQKLHLGLVNRHRLTDHP